MTLRWWRGKALSPLAVTLIYMIAGIGWVLATDHLLSPFLAADLSRGMLFANLKELFFVVLNGALVYGLMRVVLGDHRRQLAAARGREEQLRFIIETLPVPFLVVRHSDGMVLYANAWVERLSGHTVQEMIGRRAIDFYVDAVEGAPYLEDLSENDDAPGHEIRFWAKDGSVRTAFLNARPITYNGEDALVVAMVDITRRDNAETQLRRKHEVLSALSLLQDQFISDHDAAALFGRLLRTAIEVTASGNGMIAELSVGPDGALAAARRAGTGDGPDAALLRRLVGQGETILTQDRLTLPLYAGDDVVGLLDLSGRKGGYHAALLDELAPFFNSCGNLIAAFRSAVEREDAKSRLSKLSLAVEQSPAGVVITNSSGVIEYVNPSFCGITGYAPEEMVGHTPRILKSGYMPPSLYHELWSTVLSGREWRGEFYNKHKDGEFYWAQTRISPIRGTDGVVTHLLGMMEDISLRKRYEERLLHQANFDQLTNLPNRILAFDRLCQALNQAQRAERPLTVMHVDIDHFKFINDSLGNAAGDAVLVEASRRLTDCVRMTDTVARLGSDEFLMILAERSADEPTDVVARRVIEMFSHPFIVDGTELFISVSIGLTVAPGDGIEPQALLRNCGAAMNQAKSTGRNTYHFFTPGMNKQAARRLEIDSHLRHALERGEFFLHYQPFLDLSTGRMAGCEALLRWNNPTLGQVTPDRFIPLAEDTGLIVPIGQWVLRTACRQAKRWLDQGRDLSVAVNTSSRQLRDVRLVEDVTQALAETGLPPEKLELEITESLLIEDPQTTAGILGALDRLGVRLSLDDFGTGYSSLSYLKRYPFHTLKVDRSFIRDVLTDPNDRALVNAIIAMARSLNLRIVAEGVENAEQLDFLRQQGCDIIQGYHYSRPLPPDKFEEFVRELVN